MDETTDNFQSGAYCALILITLLSLPLDLPQDAPARSSNYNTFIDGLPEWISRCMFQRRAIHGLC